METFEKILFLSSLVLLFSSGEGQDMIWKTAFSLDGEHELAQDSLLTTIPRMTKEWRVSLEVKPSDYSYSSYANVLHLTIGGKGLGSGAKVGDRIPAIWIHKTRGVMISSALNGRVAYTKTFKGLPPAGEWTKIDVSQTMDGSKYFYSISIANKNLLKVENTKPVELSNVKVFGSSPWYTARRGLLRNLEVEIKVPNCVPAGGTIQLVICTFAKIVVMDYLYFYNNLFSVAWNTVFSLPEEHKIERNALLTTVPLLKEEWKVSFDFKATRFSGLEQILHITRGGRGSGSGSKYGDRTPAIWVHSSRGFLISSAVGGKYSYSKYFKPLTAAGEWTRIEVGQERVGSKMVYAISIDGKKVFSVTNSKPAQFENVKVYAASNWYSPLNGFLKNLLIQNKNEGELSPFDLDF